MAFGVSPDVLHTRMVGADAAVAWVDKDTGKGFAHDYFFKDKSQCAGTTGSCPDYRFEVIKIDSNYDHFYFFTIPKLLYRRTQIPFAFLMLLPLMIIQL